MSYTYLPGFKDNDCVPVRLIDKIPKSADVTVDPKDTDVDDE